LHADAMVHCVFDLEATGLSREHNFIAEIACLYCDHNGTKICNGRFCQFVSPGVPIPNFITTLIGIKTIVGIDSFDFEIIGKNFISFIIDIINFWEIWFWLLIVGNVLMFLSCFSISINIIQKISKLLKTDFLCWTLWN
jgi:hypothetical protein